MERQDLFNELKGWLEGEKLEFTPDPEDATFQGWMSPETGMTRVTLYCEDAPPVVQVVCSLPLKVPKEKRPRPRSSYTTSTPACALAPSILTPSNVKLCSA